MKRIYIKNAGFRVIPSVGGCWNFGKDKLTSLLHELSNRE